MVVDPPHSPLRYSERKLESFSSYTSVSPTLFVLWLHEPWAWHCTENEARSLPDLLDGPTTGGDILLWFLRSGSEIDISVILPLSSGKDD